MKKQLMSLALLVAAWLAGGSVLAQFEVSKVYTIESNNNAGKYMQDNGSGEIVTGALNANSYWEFETTGNDGCYYVKNAKTGKYMQKTSESGVSVKTGDASVEIYFKNDPAKGTTVYGMASTDRNPHDFTSDDTWGANYNSGTGVVQGFSAKLGERPNSFWKIIGHSFTNGVCSDNCTEKYQAPALVDGWYELTNAGNVEWIGQFVAGSFSGNIYPKVKMMNDIDFTGVSHSPIGPSSGKKFNGIFDGQGHRITNMVVNLNQENVGLIGWARGPQSDVGNNTTIQNLIIDKTCSFTGTGRVAAFIGRGEVSNNSNSIVYITNCVNEANVTATTGTCAAFVGTHNADDNSPRIWISGCANHGDITAGPSDKAAAFIGWYNNQGKDGGNSVIENSYNTGVVSPKDGGTILFRGSYRTITNTYDLKNSENTQGSPFRGISEWSTDDPVASGELAYYINQQAGKQVFYQTIGTDAYPIPFSTSGQVYAHGTYRCDGELLPGTTTYDNVAPIIPPHDYSNGICQNDGCTTPYQAPETDGDGYMLLANAGNVEWFSNLVATSSGSHVAKVKLTADIDFENIENLHSPIGPTTGSKFKGEFDGQGHRIMNMIINRPDAADGQGFFGWLQGNSPVNIHDLIIDSSCSITAKNKVGALAGGSQNQGGLITIENVVTEANVTGSGQDVAAIVGGETGDKATYYVHNVVNTGTITSTHEFPYAGALFCYQEKGTVENFINLGTIVGHRGGNLGRFNGTWTNVVDLSVTDMSGTVDGTNRGIVAELTTGDIASGKLAYYMNNVAGETVFYQTIGTDAYPMPFEKAGAVVYRTGVERCDGADIAGTVYSNTNSPITPSSHDNNATTGFCNVCSQPNPSFKSLVDGAYELGNHYDLTWFAAMVNTGNPAINGRLTANVDMSSVTYTPIGNNDNRYRGTFDGSGHKVNLNIDSNAYGQGFISIATGGTTIQNLVITGTVKNAGSKTAGIIAEAIGGGVITIQNCGNEATIQGTSGETAAIIANNWGYQCTLNIENVYNIGDVSGSGDVASICACQGSGSSVFKNVYNSGTVTGDAGGKFVRTSSGTYTNCYSTTKTAADNASIIETSAAAVESGELCAKLGFGFRQTKGSGYPCFDQEKGFVAQIGSAGYSTMYNVYSDVTIPDGVKAYAGEVRGKVLSLIDIDGKIKAGEPVVLEGSAGLYNFMPTTGASEATTNELLGSNGSVTGNASSIYALGVGKDGANAGKVGFYLVGSGITIPEGKAYLVYEGSLVKGFVFDFDDATAIEETLSNSPLKGENIYNLAGQRINKMQKGINIVNGKKILK